MSHPPTGDEPAAARPTPGPAAARPAAGLTDAPVRLALLGAGNRGGVYADWCARHPDRARIVAVADPDAARRETLADQHGIPAGSRYRDGGALLSASPDVDAVVIATPDRTHVVPAEAALAAGYDVLLEKPIAPDEEGVRRVRAAARASSGEVTVAHVLRHAPLFAEVRRLLDDGAVGAVTDIEHAEHVGYWHFAHSYVRGNWRRTEEASPLILAKACHDLDLLRWFAGARCEEVASRGGLTHFHAGNAPEGAPAHCLDGCPVETTCPFHAGAIYLDGLGARPGWPVSVVSAAPGHESVKAALRDGPYGRCVYRSDNDVADHQQTLLSFAGGVTATLSVSAFTAQVTRKLRIRGTGGELAADLRRGVLVLRRFAPGRGRLTATERWDLGSGAARRGDGGAGSDDEASPGHGGGDDGLMDAFVARVRARRAGTAAASAALTGLEEAVDSHLMAFAAERARLGGGVVAVPAA